MAHIREIKKRMTAVRTIQRITKTMQMIATARFTAAAARVKQTKPYTEKVKHLVEEVAAAAGDITHPLIDGPAVSPRRELLLVISSDRGLCGAYNSHVLRTGMHHIRALRGSGSEVDLYTAGKKAVGFFKFQRVPVVERLSLGDKPKYEEVQRLADRFMEAFIAGKYDAVRVAHMRFVSNSRQTPVVMQLLPLKADEAVASEQKAGEAAKSASPGGALYEFSPSADQLLAALLPLTVKTSLFQAFNDAVVSEQIMRMVAMKAATENARDLSKSLKRDYNRARQTRITTELMEVIAGAAGLE